MISNEEIVRLGYKDSYILDINNVKIYEGSVINVDGYNSTIDEPEPCFHCVEFCDGIFGSDIYSDFEPLTRYEKIEVVGHCEDFHEVYEHKEWSGNLGVSMKEKIEILEKDLEVYDVWESPNGNLFIKIHKEYSLAIGAKGFHKPTSIKERPYVKANNITPVKKVGRINFI